MKIREGAYYRTRGGYVVGPMKRTDDCMQDDYPWSSMYECWTDDGKFNIADDECEADLISKVYVSDTLPANAPAPETKTLRDEFAMALAAGFIVNCTFETKGNTAADIYKAADAMMEARKK